MARATPSRPRGATDEQVQADVLSFLLRQHPAPSVLDEILSEMAEPTYGPYSRDDVDRAVRDLAHAGLLHRQGDLVLPTRAAVRFERLNRS